jgi:hypothetical protein
MPTDQLVCSWVFLAQPPSPGPAVAGAMAKRAIRTAMTMRMAGLSRFVIRATVGRVTAADEGGVVHDRESVVAVATQAVPPFALRVARGRGDDRRRVSNPSRFGLLRHLRRRIVLTRRLCIRLPVVLELNRPGQRLQPFLPPFNPNLMVGRNVARRLIQTPEHDFGFVVAERENAAAAFPAEAAALVCAHLTSPLKVASRPYAKRRIEGPAGLAAIKAMTKTRSQWLALHLKTDGTAQAPAFAFDGVEIGHRRLLCHATAADMEPFQPHDAGGYPGPKSALGSRPLRACKNINRRNFGRSCSNRRRAP